MPEDWPVLLSFFPSNWIEMASETEALKGLRKDKEVENYIRTLLIHVACGYSLRETAARAKIAQLADISDVALIGRLRKAKDWLHRLCVELFEQKGIVSGNRNDFQVRLFDATNVKEPGKPMADTLQRSSSVLDMRFFQTYSYKGNGNRGIIFSILHQEGRPHYS